MEKLHLYSIEKFGWYKAWHEKPIADMVHWATFVSFVGILVILNVSYINETRKLALHEPELTARALPQESKGKKDAGISNIAVTDLTEPREIIIQYKKGVVADRKAAINKEERINKKHEVTQTGVGLYAIDPDDSAQEVVDRFRAKHKDDIEFISVNGFVAPTYIPNDPDLGSQWQHGVMQNQLAWDTTKGEGVTIAILDSGIDADHPDLMANIVPGYNFWDNNTDTTDVARYHGTWVSGVAGAVGDNGAAIAGSAYKVKIMPLRIADAVTGQGSWYAIYNALIYAADRGVRVANLSYGPACANDTIISGANYLRSKGGVLTISSGNTGARDASINSGVITCVGSTDSADNRAGSSTYGPWVDISAPGVYIYTTANGGGYQWVSGTSFAAPNTAAVYALMFSANPNLTPAQADSALFSTVKDLGTPGWDEYYGYGRVDAQAAVAKALTFVNPPADTIAPSVPAGLNATVNGTTQITLIWQASTDNVGVTGYNVYRNGTKIGSVSSPSYVDTGVSGGTTYSYTVSAYDAAGNISAQSGAVSVTTQAASVQFSTTPYVVSKTTNEATISWGTTKPATGVVWYGLTTNLTNSVVAPISQTAQSAIITGLASKKKYFYQVVATDPTTGATVSSAILNFRTR